MPRTREDGQRKTRVNIAQVRARVEGKIQRASEFDPNQNFVFYGDSGVGKTRLAASAPDVLMIDVDEEGTDSVRRDINPYVYRIRTWAEINDVYWYLRAGNHDFKSVAVDGVTGLQTLCMNFVLGEDRSRDASRDPDLPQRQAWGKVGQLMKIQLTNFRNLPMNTIFTALRRSRDVAEGGDEDESVLQWGPAVSPSIHSHLVASVGTVGYLVKRRVVVKRKVKGGDEVKREAVVRRRLLFADDESYISKDRNGLFGDYIDAPDVASMLDTITGGTNG